MEAPCVEAIRQTGSLFEGLGHIVEEVPLPHDEWEALRASIVLGAARQTWLRIGVKLARFFEAYDVLVTPTMAASGSPSRKRKCPGRSGDCSKRWFHRPARACLAGLPAMSVPLHRTDANRPVGVQFLGRFGDEATLLQLATQLERAEPWPMPG